MRAVVALDFATNGTTMGYREYSSVITRTYESPRIEGDRNLFPSSSLNVVKGPIRSTCQQSMMAWAGLNRFPDLRPMGFLVILQRSQTLQPDPGSKTWLRPALVIPNAWA